MSFQPMFRQFHEIIQLKRHGESAELLEKSQRIFKRLRDNLPVSFQPFYQGSYVMGTGIKPLNGHYDLDVGIELDLDPRANDPVKVKEWVYKAVSEHTARVEWRRPCITVYYQEAREVIYHVDLAILAKAPSSGSLYLALGKQNALPEQRKWQPDDRKGFMEALERRFTGEDAGQFCRVIRYLKRWKDEHFPIEGKAAPTGLALTVAAYHWFQPVKTGWHQSAQYDDLAATTALVRAMRQHFGSRLSLRFPTAPQDDVFARMNDQQMKEFRERLDKLSGWLEEAARTQSAAPLQRAFGAQFPSR
ncbi:nucleotidyltransferase [Archangium violaceum]|uniref:cyclic GMP-AMP synthase DncV-like nucleotidyltransferase n=1 Tax=Archangium violaceum TaxID=83451 RepID=UPI00193BA1FE|nr:nucleotidyltransferase [Archangium violaceum]QRK06580.1 nucleotidyltransferase [Archangium violaceum]